MSYVTTMSELDPERWRVLSPYLDEVLELADGERVPWLAALRIRDSRLADDLQGLLAEHAALNRGAFLERRLEFESDSPFAVSGSPHAGPAGRVFGAYLLESSIGQGGMGSVWLARRCDGRFDGRAAVKLLHVARLGPSGESRFRREGTILARVTHPHIAHLIDAGVSPEGQPFLVLELVDGLPIDRHCDTRALDIPARIRLFLDVLAAVAHAHANLIVHRDIKPSNVLVRADGQVKLLDFGVAKLLNEDDEYGVATRLTREHGAGLTPKYAAPEQLMGEAVTTATDVYSLGVLLYALLAGQHPGGRTLTSPADLLNAVLYQQPRRPSDVVVETRTQPGPECDAIAASRASTPERLRRLLRGDLDTIVAKALKKDPKARYPSVTALADDLRRYLACEPISARRDSFTYRTTRFVGRHARATAAAIIGVLLLAAVVTFYTVWLAKERDRARVEAAKSAKVSELLMGLLTNADPYSDKAEPTVRGVLDSAAARLPKELEGQPAVKAEILPLLGRIYQRLNLYDKAQPLLEEGVALGRRVLGPDDPRLAYGIRELGVLVRERGDAAASIPLLEEALAMETRVLGRANNEVAITLVEMGRSYEDLGRPDRGEPVLREALAIRRQVLGDAHRETATSLGDLGKLLREKGDLAGAEEVTRQNVAITRQVLGPNHPNLAGALNNLALVVGSRGRHAEAEALLRESQDITYRVKGRTNLSVAIGLNNLSNAVREQGRDEEARGLAEEAVRMGVPILGDEHPTVATFRISLARVQLARHEPDKAEPVLRQALRTRERVLPAGDWRIAQARSLLGAALAALGRYDEAEPLLVQAQAALRDVPGMQGREAKDTQARLDRLRDARQRLPRAVPGGRS